MSWLSLLEKTYDNSSELWGKIEEGDKPGAIPLLRVGQSTQNAQIEITLDQNAEVISAHIIEDKPEQMTVIPCTEGSIGRTGSKIAPHPLHDKIQYVAGDYKAFGGDKASGWDAYMEQINQWCDSSLAHHQVDVVRRFTGRGHLIEEIKPHFASQQQLLELVKENAFVRFRVDNPGSWQESRLWLDQSVADKFLEWQNSLDNEKGLCYASGEIKILSVNHPAKLRNTGDKAKLISANDTSGFTFRGRFTSDKQAVGVSYESSQKAHNMLKWLISHQGYRNDSQVFITWGTKLQKLPNPEADSHELFGEEEEIEERWGQNLRRDYALRVKKAMQGYSAKVSDADDVVVMGLESATPGRLSIIFYREFSGSDYLKRIEEWHRTCAWLHSYKSRDKKIIAFYGAPSPLDIAYAAYGSTMSDKLKKTIIERLMHCIVDGKPIPSDIRESLVRRAGNPVAMEGWEWNKTMSIACAVVRKHMYETGKGDWDMDLDENNVDRSFLFGRLLAYARHIESYSQFLSGNAHRETNAERMMHQFSLRPAKTWAQLYMKLGSYIRQLKMPGLANQWNTEMEKIIGKIGDGFTNSPLEEQFILGYSVQSMALRNKKNNDTEGMEDDAEQEN